MQFKHPEILYALLLLLIPIIVHLFQLRRFQKVPFTNVAFLKEITLQTRKSSTLKKWITLITRLLLLGAIIIAFSQPYTSKKKRFSSKEETVIYLDNSFSMQAKGERGPLLKRSIQELIENLDESEPISIITNTKQFKNTTISAIKNDLLQLGYSSNQLKYNNALLQAKNSFKKDENSIKNLILISDFQRQDEVFNPLSDSLINLNLVKLSPVKTSNLGVDSLFVSDISSTNTELSVVLKNQGEPAIDVPVSLYNNNTLLAKSSLDIETETTAKFTIPTNSKIEGKIVIQDTELQYDNTLFFNFNEPETINVLSINNTNDTFLKRVFNNSEFNYKSVSNNNINYNDLENQNLIIVNELNTLPNSLITALLSFERKGGTLLIIPSNEIDLSSYNQLFINISSNIFSTLIKQEKRITKINFSHPLFKGVFSKTISNFQYPKVNHYYQLSSSGYSKILEYEDNSAFLLNKNNLFAFTASLNIDNSNFVNSPLIVPTIYNIGKQSLMLSEPYYTIGMENKIDVKTRLKQDEILTLEKEDIKVIPKQQTYRNRVSLVTSETPEIAGIYQIKNNDNSIENISFNYNRKESNLDYINLNEFPNVNISNSVSEIINTIKSNTKVNELWKWFIIFALVLLIFEMLILKFFK